ncbi:MAG TPA: hypothetical protein VFE47_03185 [Tepidisphaeraceae bacterium]|jgi:hypothetical protein|nr:hypothetical protein [Tepidisphaeraceae bacterium]
MPLTCNIDAKGKAVRLVYGIVVLLLGAALGYWWALGSGSFWRWGLSGVCVLGGLFALFESRAGWCVVRAMGIKTPM